MMSHQWKHAKPNDPTRSCDMMRCIGPPQDAILPAPVMQVLDVGISHGTPIIPHASNSLANHGAAGHHHLPCKGESDGPTARVSTSFGQPDADDAYPLQ
jgi:hypothetical protein